MEELNRKAARTLRMSKAARTLGINSMSMRGANNNTNTKRKSVVPLFGTFDEFKGTLDDVKGTMDDFIETLDVPNKLQKPITLLKQSFVKLGNQTFLFKRGVDADECGGAFNNLDDDIMMSELFVDLTFLQSVPMFANAQLKQREVYFLMAQLQNVSYEKGDYLSHPEDDECDPDYHVVESGIYFIRSGSVEIVPDEIIIDDVVERRSDEGGEEEEGDDHRSSVTTVLSKGDHFGEESMVPDEKGNYPEQFPCNGKIRAAEHSYVGFLSSQSILNVLSKQRLAKSDDSFDRNEHKVHRHNTNSMKLPRFDDLVQHRLIGRGSFGKVWLVSDKDDKTTPFALKVVNKLQCLKADGVQDLNREREVMKELRSPFITRLHATYQTDSEVCFLMQFVQGGELHRLIHPKRTSTSGDDRRGLGEDRTRFYGACIYEALYYMHCRGFINRDVKPGNILINFNGYPILIDLGFSKRLRRGARTMTYIGTLAYMAPEVMARKGYNMSADLWSFGVCMYEMLVGVLPFEEDAERDRLTFPGVGVCDDAAKTDDDDEEEEGEGEGGKSQEDDAPVIISDEARSFISDLLQVDPSKRLGAYCPVKVRAHPFFREIEWEKLTKKQLKAPFLPRVSFPMDLSCYPEPRQTMKMRASLERTKSPPLTPKQQAMFKNF